MHSGGLGQWNRMLQAPLYEKISDILGSTGTIIPLADQIDESPFQPSSTVPDLAPTFSEAVSAWDTPFNFNDPDSYQGYIPFLTFNGSDEYVTYPDDAYLSRVETGNPFSVGAWVWFDDLAANSYIMAKYDSNEAIQEWFWMIRSDEKPLIQLRDDSAAVNIDYKADSGIATGQWHFVVITYDSTGGSSALSDNNSPIYVDGAVVAGTASNNGSYVAMEAGTSKLSIGGGLNGASLANPFTGKVAGGALGPFFTQSELSAAQIAHLYRLGRQALEL